MERPERNGTEDGWNGSTSPRKELSGVGSGGGGAGGRPENNWRAREALKEQQRERAEAGGGGGKEDEEGWRTAGRAGTGGGERWTRSAGWRSERTAEGDRDTGGAATEECGRIERPHRPWEDEGGRPAGYKKIGGHHPNRRAWDDGPDSLPEW